MLCISLFFSASPGAIYHLGTLPFSFQQIILLFSRNFSSSQLVLLIFSQFSLAYRMPIGLRKQDVHGRKKRNLLTAVCTLVFVSVILFPAESGTADI
jgi:hypothetical protein